MARPRDPIGARVSSVHVDGNGWAVAEIVSGKIFPARYLAEYAPTFEGSAAMRAIRDMVESIADTDATVLLRGESGVGKDLVARAIHAASKRCDDAFVKVNCAAIPPGLLESELFGHEKGAFTGAHRRKPGQFEFANKGTMYLDEIADLPLGLQAKLLHVLQDFRFSRVGGHGMIDVDVRVLAATNRDLEREMGGAHCGKVLNSVLNGGAFALPAWRDGKEEPLVVGERSRERSNRQYGRTKKLSAETRARLLEHAWRGNVRELENVI